MLDRTASMADRVSMRSRSALKIGLFGANCSSGRSATKVPERWQMTWPECRSLAQMADEAGIDFMLPIGRWKGYGGDTDFHGTTFETVTWATGLLAATKRITVFGTVHAPLFNPIIAAKKMVTADHIGAGRFGLNIVVGWNEGEFEMFGVEQREQLRPLPVCVVLVIGKEGRSDAVPAGEDSRDPGVLAGDQVDIAQRIDRARARIGEVADGGRHDVEDSCHLGVQEDQGARG